MAEIEVTVRGVFSAFQSPERATVTLNVGHQGASKSEVYAATVASANRVATAIQALADAPDGPVTWWSSERLRTWSQKPWNKDGKQLPLVHHAATSAQAKFRDFAALGAFLDDAVPLPGVSVEGISWTLTVAREQQLVAQARAQAVQDAAAKAAHYAAALGLHSVFPVAVADVGMLGGARFEGGSAMGVAYARGSAGGAAEPLRLQPQDIEVSAQVDARFLAR
jgi:uncharacterized protein YggE